MISVSIPGISTSVTSMLGALGNFNFGTFSRTLPTNGARKGDFSESPFCITVGAGSAIDWQFQPLSFHALRTKRSREYSAHADGTRLQIWRSRSTQRCGRWAERKWEV